MTKSLINSLKADWCIRALGVGIDNDADKMHEGVVAELMETITKG